MNPWIEYVKQVQRDNNCSYKKALSIASSSYQKGSGLFKRLDTRPKALEKFLRSNPKKRIIKVQACRTPLSNAVQSTLNFILRKELSTLKKNYDYDKLFHLYLVMHFDDGSQYLIEKNTIVNIEKYDGKRDNTECTEYFIVNMKFKDLIEKAEQSYKNLYRYSSTIDNCQKFVLTLLHILEIRAIDDFVHQYHVRDVITNRGVLKLSNFITDTAAITQRYLLGKGKSDGIE